MAALCSAFIVFVTLWRLEAARDAAFANHRTAAENLARSLADNTAAKLQAADIIVAGLAQQAEYDGTVRATSTRLREMLAWRAELPPGVRDLSAYAANGNVLVESKPNASPGRGADRDLLAYHAQHAQRQAHIGVPVRDPGTEQWSVSLSRRIDLPDGGFAGIVVLTLELTGFYSTFDLGPHGSMSLVRQNGTMIIRVPYLEGRVGANIAAGPFFRAYLAHPGGGSAEAVSKFDGRQRQESFSTVTGFPLAVFVASTREDILTVWRGEELSWLSVSVLSAILVNLLAWRLARQFGIAQQAGLKIRASEERYRLLADHSSDMIIRLGPDQRPHYISPSCQRMLGFPPAALLGRRLSEIVHEDDHAVMQANLAEIAQTGEAVPVSLRLRDRAGDFVWVEAMGRKVQSDQSTIFSIRDIALRKNAETLVQTTNSRLTKANLQLESLARHLAHARDVADAANRAKSQFLAAMSHELRTPLNGILGYAHLLRLDASLDCTQERRVNAMLSAGAHLLQMINRVLDLSEIEHGQTKAALSEFDLRDLAQACVDLVLPNAISKHLEIALVVSPEVPTLFTTDPTLLRQVLINLLGNAVKFTAAGSVSLKLEQADADALHIEVTDTGPGISAEQRHRLFRNFERLGVGPTQNIEGAGLGLALSSRLTELIGGHLDCRDNPRGGSTFWFELRSVCAVNASRGTLTTTGVERRFSELAVTPQRQPFRPMRILVVDDEPMNRDIAASFLRSAGHSVALADSGVAGVAAAATTIYDVILMDVRMREMDGLEATRRIRRLPGQHGQVLIVALTAQVFADQIEQCSLAGMDTHLAKPFSPDALLDMVDRVGATARTREFAAAVPPDNLEGATVTADATEYHSGLLVFDRDAFDRTSACLAPKAVVAHLRNIVERGSSLLDRLNKHNASLVDALSLADEAHALAGSAGMFGLQRLVTIAGQFERAVGVGDDDLHALAAGLAAATEASLTAIREIPEFAGEQPACGEALLVGARNH